MYQLQLNSTPFPNIAHDWLIHFTRTDKRTQDARTTPTQYHSAFGAGIKHEQIHSYFAARWHEGIWVSWATSEAYTSSSPRPRTRFWSWRSPRSCPLQARPAGTSPTDDEIVVPLKLLQAFRIYVFASISFEWMLELCGGFNPLSHRYICINAALVVPFIYKMT